MSRISVYILTLNEANKIEDAIKSVAWADEIVVADSGSNDGTVEIAEKLGARVVQIALTKGFGKMRSDAIAACAHDWVFSLDADERCTPAAREEIQRIIQDANACDAYFVPRRNYFMGRWIRHCGWYPDYRQPQLFRRGLVHFHDDTQTVHDGYTLKGSKGYLKSAIWQIPFINLEQMLHKMQRYSSLSADKLEQRGRRSSMISAFMHGLWAFFRIYVIKLGVLDGWPGFVIALGNFEGTFYRYAKLVERQNSWGNPPGPPPS